MGAHINSKGIHKTIGSIRTSANNFAAHASKLSNQTLNFEQILQSQKPKCIHSCIKNSQIQLNTLLKNIENTKENLLKNTTHNNNFKIIAKLRQEAIMMYDITLKTPL
ncbi:hypothetical protein CINS5915_06840 [Campylobacter insulaenigrae]|uniref:Uncharacterized protein n=1 Tax=Campylobacter insulaenigrae TaxID=260714 RepID=A0ABY3G3U0_9BACT|nr:hypothetical protein [Campylobacter insulaenigrae]MCR6571010.1 hypothetical protein [Campylobacter insulaenigrae]MCR6572864.1 hypothetical protein [Campylobacter insulaenigrae]MCR6574494.1 hypothetical protein [Campylobacter insulaenigrae]MCR6576077.1 hypothetical protein [Campylobacter insulaenigrae]MCR6577596.1 hypothetical protein [Campylobacter insulaenigrae]